MFRFDYPPSSFLLKKRENIKRLERIKVLTTYDKHRNILPLERETNLMILNDKDLFRMAFTKHPNLAEFISCKIPKSILDDEDFMIEMYHLTKCIKIFRDINSESLLFRLLKINLDFFDHCSYDISTNKRIIKKCLKEYPELISAPTLYYKIRNEYHTIFSAVKQINSIKTFLLCVNTENSLIQWMKGCSGLYIRKIYEYLKPIYYVKKCNSDEFHLELCKGHNKRYKVCENFEERKELTELIKSKSSSDYGFRVI